MVLKGFVVLSRWSDRKLRRIGGGKKRRGSIFFNQCHFVVFHGQGSNAMWNMVTLKFVL